MARKKPEDMSRGELIELARWYSNRLKYIEWLIDRSSGLAEEVK